MKAVLMVAIAATLAAGASVAAGASGPVAGASGKRPLLIANCLKPKFKPADVILACGDASLGARDLTWSSWTQKSAVGTGTGQINDCNPDCVHGTTKTAPMELRLSKPQKCRNGRRVFSKLRFTWTAGAPVGAQTLAIPLGCKLLDI
jgi:hypothetical protein